MSSHLGAIINGSHRRAAGRPDKRSATVFFPIAAPVSVLNDERHVECTEPLGGADLTREQHEHGRKRTPSETLLLAILERAIRDVLFIEDQWLTSKEDHADAVAWFASDSQDVHSFVWLCGHLRLEPDAVRRGLEKNADYLRKVLREHRKTDLTYRVATHIRAA